ncbi:hypothetical protein DL98DRAFT_513364 [Cadophora sp. DSE1049]|nr:hypothetical protein DL98DRAFT_513364 [Cadophora sp. DSE1049]
MASVEDENDEEGLLPLVARCIEWLLTICDFAFEVVFLWQCGSGVYIFVLLESSRKVQATRECVQDWRSRGNSWCLMGK